MILLRRLDAFIRAYPRLSFVACALAAWAGGVISPQTLPFAFLVGIVQLDDVNTITTKDIMPGVADNFFKSGPVMAYLRARFNRKWAGPQIQENYLRAEVL